MMHFLSLRKQKTSRYFPLELAETGVHQSYCLHLLLA